MISAFLFIYLTYNNNNTWLQYCKLITRNKWLFFIILKISQCEASRGSTSYIFSFNRFSATLCPTWILFVAWFNPFKLGLLVSITAPNTGIFVVSILGGVYFRVDRMYIILWQISSVISRIKIKIIFPVLCTLKFFEDLVLGNGAVDPDIQGASGFRELGLPDVFVCANGGS